MDSESMDRYREEHEPESGNAVGLSGSNALVMRELDDIDSMILNQIDNTDEVISALSAQVLKMRHNFLRKNGWDISCEMISCSETCFYRKNDEMFICEHDAIDYELYGA